jgi:hypothetical protein
MIRIPLKILETVVKQGSKEIDLSNPMVIDTVNFFLEVGKEIIKPW